MCLYLSSAGELEQTEPTRARSPAKPARGRREPSGKALSLSLAYLCALVNRTAAGCAIAIAVVSFRWLQRARSPSQVKASWMSGSQSVTLGPYGDGLAPIRLGESDRSARLGADREQAVELRPSEQHVRQGVKFYSGQLRSSASL